MSENNRSVVCFLCVEFIGYKLVLHRLRVFKSRVLWKIFGPKRDEVTVD
jgi:hypothetical protein